MHTKISEHVDQAGEDCWSKQIANFEFPAVANCEDVVAGYVVRFVLTEETAPVQFLIECFHQLDCSVLSYPRWQLFPASRPYSQFEDSHLEVRV